MNEDKASRYHRLKRLASLASAAVAALFLVLLLVTGGAMTLRDAAWEAAGGFWAPAVVLYCVALAAAVELLQLPLAFYQDVVLERRYGLSTQSVGKWAADHVKGGLLGLALAIGAAVVVMGLLRWFPGVWWVVAAVVCGLVLVLLASIGPVLVLPLFSRVTPLRRDALAARLEALATRAGVPVIGVFEWEVSDRTRKANAALAGLGRTRRILLSDTLLAEHSEDEVAVILAHELAHHRYRDLWTVLGVDALILLLAFRAADLALAQLAGPLGLAGTSDLAGLPLLLLVTGGVGVALAPLVNALSRLHERRADRYALELTRDVPSFVSAMRRLGAQNLAEEQPSRLVELLFHTHPPIAARIAAAQRWRPAR